MSAPDEPKRLAKEQREPVGDELETLDPHDLATLSALEEAGDVGTLRELAKAYETGDGEVDQDVDRAVLAYEGASRLGDVESCYWLARRAFGEATSADVLERGVRFLRLAADGGHVEARVFLGNLYELGVHYEVDVDKADLWYRSAARAAGIDSDAGTPEWSVEMAQLGCVRSIVPLLEDDTIPKKHRLVYLRLVKNVGYELFLMKQRAAQQAEASERRRAALEEAERERAEDHELVESPAHDAKLAKAEAVVTRAEAAADAGRSTRRGLSFARIFSSLALAGGATYGGLYLHQIGQVWLADPIYQAAALGGGVLVLALLALGIRKKT